MTRNRQLIDRGLAIAASLGHRMGRAKCDSDYSMFAECESCGRFCACDFAEPEQLWGYVLVNRCSGKVMS